MWILSRHFMSFQDYVTVHGLSGHMVGTDAALDAYLDDHPGEDGALICSSLYF